MLKKSLLFLAATFFFFHFCYAYQMWETENFVFSLDTYYRNDLVSWKNVADLDSSNSDDTTTYLGIDYSFGSLLEFKQNGPKFYLKLERNGPFDYDAPLFVHNTLMNNGGVVGKYRNDELLPNVEEFWLDTPLFNAFRFKVGLHTYEVGNAFSLNGGYENYGFILYREAENFTWRMCYHRPDLVYKNHLGPHISQDEEQGIDYNHNASNFFATDVKFNVGKQTFWPYVGVLADYTAQGKRDNIFTAPIKRDILGTLGMSWNFKQDKLSLGLEMAHNFGQAKSEDPTYKDVRHSGYLIYTEAKYNLGKFIPSLQFLLCSGNKVKPEMAGDSTLTSGKNRAFSYYSPLNKNLGESISSNNSDMRPLVFTGAGYGLSYGTPRPRTFSTTDFDNLILPCLGFDFNATEKLYIGLYGYYINAFSRPVGTLNGEGKYLSRELGYEADLFIDYQLNKNVLLSFLGGYFFPGKYYKEHRGDTDGSLLNSYLRGDGDADSAYQIEVCMEFKF